MADIKKNYLIEKRNVLNEVRDNNMTLQELRFFSIYLSKINARDVSTRVVRFSMTDFQKIMDMVSFNMTQIKNSTDRLLCQIVRVPLETGTGYKAFQIFKKCTVSKDEKDEWYFEIDAHDDALPLMFEFKDRYFTYELWNALRLKSANQLRMYELLKQYERIGERIVLIDDLKELLGMKKSDYPRYDRFKERVIDACQEALAMYTDITFDYEPIRKKGRGGTINALKFIISKNDSYADPLSLADFIDIERAKTGRSWDDSYVEIEFADERLSFLSDACNNEFTEAEIQVLYNLITQIVPRTIGGTASEYKIRAYDHLKHMYDMLNLQAERREIKDRFSYFKKMLQAQIIEEN